MVAAQLKISDSGMVSVVGTLSFENATSLLDESVKVFDGESTLQFDLQAVDKSDSAGLALLVEWMSLATKKGQSVSFVNLPKQMLDIASVSGLNEVLPLA